MFRVKRISVKNYDRRRDDVSKIIRTTSVKLQSFSKIIAFINVTFEKIWFFRALSLSLENLEKYRSFRFETNIFPYEYPYGLFRNDL